MRFRTLLWLSGWLVLLTGLPGWAQSALPGAVEWTGTTQLTMATGKTQRVPTFRGAAYAPGELLGTYTLRVAGRVAEGQLTDLQYVPFAAAEAALLTGATLPAGPAPTLRTGTAARQAFTFVDFQPFRRNPQTGQAEKLVAFRYAYSAADAGPTTARRGQARTHKAASVLRQGTWYKIGVPRAGVYKLDKAALTALGVDVATTDPRRLQLFGNAAGGMLPQLNSAPRPDDLEELALGFSGNNDAVFDDNEYVLFYSRGPHTWQPDPAPGARLFHHTLNLYTDTAYYFVTVGAAGRRVAAAGSSAAPTATITTFAHRDFHEQELVNLSKSGRQWLGERLENGSPLEVPFSVPNAVPNAPVRLTSSVVASAVTQTGFQLALNGQAVSTQTVVAINTNGFPERANTSLVTYSATAAALPADTRLRYAFASNGDGSARGWLDYVELNAQRQLRYVGGGQQLDFRSFDNIAPGAASRFALDNAAGATVWDVTSPNLPLAYALTSGGFVAPTDTLREFVAFQAADLYAPRLFGRVPNQDLHALNLDGKLDLVIVTHPLFRAEADRLAAHRRTHDGLTVAVVTTAQVYNEYSSGGQDITAIRDLMKQVYDRTPAGKRNFLLLFGDASFDYKSDPTNDLTQVPNWWKNRYYLNTTQSVTSTTPDKINQNYVPVYESIESFAVVAPRLGHDGVTYSSDDYFGLLDDDEGTWSEGFGQADELLDIGVGRLPVRVQNATPIAAQTVDKLIAYDQPATYGKWRNRLTFVADDGDYNLHTLYSAEPLANGIVNSEPAYNVHKVYLDLYPQESTPSGQRSPECAQAIDAAFEQGSLLINYSGHGGVSGWADEQILTKASITNLTNTQRLAFLLTATCDFSTYDDPEFTSAGEEILTDITSGAVGLLTTTRLVYSNNNQALAEQFYASVFEPVNGALPRLGDILAETKNNSVRSVYNRNFSFLGDPSGRLAYPEQTVALRTVNGHAFTATPTDTLKSLSSIALTGDVRTGGAVNTRFNGTAQVTVYDKPTISQTLGDQPTDGVQPIRVQESVLYDGQATVRNGQFALNFVVPKDINYSLGLGKISLYAADASAQVDAHGATPATIGGLDTQAPRDTIPPRITLFLDTEAFVFGGLTGTSPTLLARLRDKSGINTAGAGIGHEITATLDNDPAKLTILNDFYTADVDSFQTGRVRYLFKDLKPGPHVLRLKAWDTFNNSGEKEIEFIAASTEKLAIQHVLNYPNPFSRATTFHFDQNRTGDDLDVQVQIFTVSGKLVRTLNATVVGSESHLAALSWDGRDEFNDQLARGVYVYRLSVRSPRDGAAASKFEKLVILN